MNNKIVITGNIGSGKSTVTKILKDLGYHTNSADEISARILEENHEKITKMFDMTPQKFGTFKKKLSDMVFMDPKLSTRNFKKELEDFMLPKIQKEIDWLYENNPDIIIEMPTFFETRGLSYDYGEDYYIIHIHADKNIRINRVLERNKYLSIQDVLDRIKTQLDPTDKLIYSHYNIENNGTEEELKNKVYDLLRGILGAS
jgi:dephospho-CoA kinase